MRLSVLEVLDGRTRDILSDPEFVDETVSYEIDGQHVYLRNASISLVESDEALSVCVFMSLCFLWFLTDSILCST